MKPEKYTKAWKAIEAGKVADQQGKQPKGNPYTLAKYAGLRAWWTSGFIEAEQQKNQITGK